MNKDEYDWWKNGPGGFNRDYKPHAIKVRKIVTESMERDDFYTTHTREECKVEWNKRYDEIMKNYEKNA